MSKKWTLTDSGLQVREGAKHIATVHYAGNPSVDINEAIENAKIIQQAPEQAARIAALEAEKAKLIEALIKAESALTYANWDGEFDSSYTAKDVINARDTARAVLAEVTGHAK